METKMQVHIDGFDDPLVGHLKADSSTSPRTLFGTERPGTVRAEGTSLVVNHEEQYSVRKEEKGFDDPLLGYTVAFEEPIFGREKLEEMLKERYGEPREMTIAVSEDGEVMKIG